MSNFVLNNDTVLCEDCYDDIYPANQAEVADQVVMGTTDTPCSFCGPSYPGSRTLSHDESDRLWREQFARWYGSDTVTT